MNDDELWWAKTRALTIATLAIWGVFGYLIHVFVLPLNDITILGFPLGFYMAAQGSPIVFVALIFWFANRQDAIDRAHDVARTD